MEAPDPGLRQPLYSNPRGLYPFQAELVAYCYLRPRNLAVVDTGLGKQAPLSEPVLTPDGWSTMGEVRVGSYVVGADGSPTMVTGVHPQVSRTVYRVQFSDGSWTRCGPDHLWHVSSRRATGPRGQQTNGWHAEVISTDQILARKVKSPAGRRRFCIPMCSPVEYATRDLPVDPYTLGVILGDGSITRHGSAHITTDTEIIDSIVMDGARHRISPHASDGIGVLWSREWQDGLLSLGLAGKRSWEKHVPVEYLHAGVEQRRALLAGLIDTDGHPMADGGIEFSSASEALTAAVAELAESLGGTARRRPAKQTGYFRGGERVACRQSWIVNIKVSDNPFRLARKAALWVQPTKYPPARWIESITQVDDEESVCISVEAPDGLYLTRHHVVTHNTHLALATAALLIEDGQVDTVLICAEGNKIDEWMDDIAQFTGLTALKYQGEKARRRKLAAQGFRGAQVIVTTYHTAREDLIEKKAPGFLLEALSARKMLVCYDEVTLLSGRTSALHKAHAKLIYDTGARALGLTATPVTNGPESFYNLGRIFCPDRVGSEADFFKNHVVRVDSFGRPAQFRNLDLLAEKVAPVLLRKRKTDDDVKDQFPKAVEEFPRVRLYDDHQDLYDELDEMIQQLDEHVAQFGFDLLQNFANHPRSILDSDAKLAYEFLEGKDIAAIEAMKCAKSESVVRQVKAISMQEVDNQSIIFCDSVAVLRSLAADLEKAKVTFALYHGGLDHAAREASKAAFKSGQVKVLLSSSAGERGINLPEASYVINYDTPLMHSSYIQRLSRASRIGSRAGEILVVKTFIAADTVEEGALRTWNRRNAQSDALVDFDVDEADPDFVSAVARRALINESSRRRNPWTPTTQ